MADPGATVSTGTELYAVDGEPVVAIVAGTPSWRTLKTGVSDGSDVRMLEKALVKLGFADGIEVDEHFTSGTADAVERWEKSLGREDPDGEVDPGETVLVGANSQVVDRSLELGDPVPNGAQVLTLATTERVITARVDADDIAAWGKNATVAVHWDQGNAIAGRVTSAGWDIEDGTAAVTVVPKSGTITRHNGTAAEVELVTQHHDDVLTVPVAALRDGPAGRPSVTVITDGAAVARSVTLGLVAQGRAEVTSGLRVGERVLLPGS